MIETVETLKHKKIINNFDVSITELDPLRSLISTLNGSYINISDKGLEKVLPCHRFGWVRVYIYIYRGCSNRCTP